MWYLLWVFFLFVSYSVSAAEIVIADKATYQVKVAETEEELTRGLMFVKEMPRHEGMWFDLRSYSGVAMWMKNTYISLDMLFIDCDYQIVDIKENCQPQSLDKIISKKPFCYVLELNGGEVANNHIVIGDYLQGPK